MSEKRLNPTHVEVPVEPISKTGHIIATQQIEATVDGPQQVTPKFKQNNTKWALYFTTSTPGQYTVNLKHKGEHLKLSPFTVTVRIKENNEEDLPPPVLPEIPKNHVNFEVDAYDQHGKFIDHSESFGIEVAGPEEVTPQITRNGDKIAISFDTYISEGSFSVSVKYYGAHIQRSPFEINITPSDSHEQREYKLQKAATLEPLPPHREIQFTVLARLRDGSYTKAHEVIGTIVLGEDGDNVNTRIEDDHSQPNSITISFDALKPGKHKVSVTHKSSGQQIANSPFSIQVPPEAFHQRK
jgi:hypothetical protein